MKKIHYLLLAGLIMLGCNKEIHITQPTILIKSENLTVSESIEISVTEYAEINGTPQKPDYFRWSILNKAEETILSDFENSSSINWVPDSAGYFIIKVEIGYDNNKSITTLKEITILESTQSLQNKLIGNWSGNVESMFGLSWKIDITFDEYGHYIASAYDLSNNQYTASPFYYGFKLIDNPSGSQMTTSPSPDIPCQSFIIDEVINKKGYGVLSLGYEYEISGEPYSYNCVDNFEIENLEFIDKGNKLNFSLIDFGSNAYEWYLKYHLIRVE